MPLSPSGIEALLRLKKQNIYPPGDLFFTSKLNRAIQSAILLYGDVPITELEELNEYDFGIFEMKSFDEIKGEKAFIAWVNDDTGTIACPNGESQQAYVGRVLNGFNTVVCQAYETGSGSVVLLSHRGVIVRIMQHLFPALIEDYSIQPDNGHGYTINYSTEQQHSYAVF